MSLSELLQPEPNETDLAIAQKLARIYLKELESAPSSCAIYESAIGDDQVLKTLGWRGTVIFINALNDIHGPAGCDNPALHSE